MSDVPLPSFLTRTGPASYTLTYSASGATTKELCEMKFAWAYITRIEGAATRAGQNYGAGLHLPIAHYYRNLSRPRDLVLEECRQVIRQHFEANPQPALGRKGRPEFRTAPRAIQAFDAWIERWKGTDDFTVLGVEEPFEVELGEFTVPGGYVDSQDMGSGPSMIALPATTVTVRIRGIRDLRLAWHGQRWVKDVKTSTEWSDSVIDDGRASFQFQLYGWVERYAEQHELPAGGAIGDYIVSREPYAEGRKPKANDLPRDQFHREPYPYSDAQLAEWHEDAMGIGREIFACWQAERWPRRRGACAHWGRCEYYRLCWETDPSYRMAAAMSADYRPRTPSPFEDEANGKERT